MKAAKKPLETVEYMEYPTKKNPAPEWFDDAVNTGIVYRLAETFYVRTGVGTVCFPPKGYVLFRHRSGALSVMERSEFFRLFEEVKQ